MTQLTLQIPVVGQSDSTEDPKVANSLTSIQSWANGNIDHTNLSNSAGILPAQLALNAVRLTFISSSAGGGALAGRLYETSTATAVYTLPSAVGIADQQIGFLNVSGGTITVQCTAQNIGFIGGPAASFTLGGGGRCVILQSDGSNWYVISFLGVGPS